MSERWQREISKLRTARLGDDLWDRIATGPRLELPPPEPRHRVPTIVIAVALAAAATVLVWSVFSQVGRPAPTLSGSDVVDVPPRGEVAPVFLLDGRPVFVVHHEDGGVSVVDAFSSHRAWGVEELVVWCATSRQFVEWAHEAHFGEYGTWRSAGPAPTGLATFAFDVVRRDDAGDPSRIAIGEMLPPDPRGSGPVTHPPYPPFCPEAADGSNATLAHTVNPALVYDSPAEAVRASPSGWIAVRGTMLIASDGFVRLCVDVDGERCRGGAIVRGIDGVGLLVNVLTKVEGRTAYEVPRIWLARVRGDVLDDIAIGDIRTG